MTLHALSEAGKIGKAFEAFPFSIDRLKTWYNIYRGITYGLILFIRLTYKKNKKRNKGFPLFKNANNRYWVSESPVTRIAFCNKTFILSPKWACFAIIIKTYILNQFKRVLEFFIIEISI